MKILQKIKCTIESRFHMKGEMIFNFKGQGRISIYCPFSKLEHFPFFGVIFHPRINDGSFFS
jgi:hypothetical protein